MLDNMTTSTTPSAPIVSPDPARVRRAMLRRSVATLATVSPAGRPHAATVLYQLVDDALYVSTMRDSRKARNVAATGLASVVIDVRRLPAGPPASIQFQTTAEVLFAHDPRIVDLANARRLDRIVSHGELELGGACFLRIAVPARVHTYALGMSLWRVLRDPLHAAGEVEFRRAP
jgi:hypothetical protein